MRRRPPRPRTAPECRRRAPRQRRRGRPPRPRPPCRRPGGPGRWSCGAGRYESLLPGWLHLLVVAQDFLERADEVLSPIEHPAAERRRERLHLLLVRLTEEHGVDGRVPARPDLLELLAEPDEVLALIRLAVRHDHDRGAIVARRLAELLDRLKRQQHRRIHVGVPAGLRLRDLLVELAQGLGIVPVDRPAREIVLVAWSRVERDHDGLVAG